MRGRGRVVRPPTVGPRGGAGNSGTYTPRLYVAPPRNPPRGPAGDSGATTEYEFELTIWTQTVIESDWEGYGRISLYDGSDGRYKAKRTVESAKVPFTIRAVTEAGAVAKAAEALGFHASEVEDTGYPRTKTTVAIHHTIANVREVR